MLGLRLIYVSKIVQRPHMRQWTLDIIGLGIGLLSIWRQAVTWTRTD